MIDRVVSRRVRGVEVDGLERGHVAGGDSGGSNFLVEMHRVVVYMRGGVEVAGACPSRSRGRSRR